MFWNPENVKGITLRGYAYGTTWVGGEPGSSGAASRAAPWGGRWIFSGR